MFEIENISEGSCRLWEGEEHVGYFECYDSVWVYDHLDGIRQETNPNIFLFILKTLENLNNGVRYD
jgi:hypothetical protein